MTTPDVEKAAEECARDSLFPAIISTGFKAGVAWARATPPVTQGESAEAAADRIGRDKDKNNNPDVFSRWSFLAGHASAEGEIAKCKEERQWLLNQKSADWPHQREHYENRYKKQETEIAELQATAKVQREMFGPAGVKHIGEMIEERDALKAEIAQVESVVAEVGMQKVKAEAERDALRADVTELVTFITGIACGVLVNRHEAEALLARFRKGG